MIYEEISQLYNALYDEKSKRNFMNRLANNLTGNGQYLVNMIEDNCNNVETPNIAEYYKGKLEEKKVIVYGAFTSGKTRYDFEKYLGIENIYCFCDKDVNKQKNNFCGKKVISPDTLVEEYKDCYVIIETKYYYDEVYKFLTENGFPKKNIINHADNGIQYFDYEYMIFGDEEIMIDGGCYDCETLKEFIKKVNGHYNSIIAIEPDKKNYDNCVLTIQNEKIQNVKMLNVGLWSEDTQLAFEGNNLDCSRIVAEKQVLDENKIDVVAIDSICENQKVSFIKMDIEGAELKALTGAKETIKKYKPKLAICIYHKLKDITNIQRYLMGIVPEYRFGIRHYTDHAFETVLYAFVPGE